MRLTFIIVSVIFFALMTYARLLAVAQDAARPGFDRHVITLPVSHQTPYFLRATPAKQ